MSLIFIVVLRTWKSLTPKDVMEVKGLTICLICDLFIKINGDTNGGSGNDVEIAPVI
jgi:hypothetical protein